MTEQMFSPQAAAKHVGTSRSAIMRALASKTLPASRDNLNRWQISRIALEAWAGDRPDKSDTDQNTVRTVVADSAELIEARTKIATLTAEIEGLRDRLDDTQRERDRLAGLLDRALETRTVQTAPGLFARLFGRR